MRLERLEKIIEHLQQRHHLRRDQDTTNDLKCKSSNISSCDTPLPSIEVSDMDFKEEERDFEK